ncbi:MAG: alpha/beta hydrolase [Ilumatobacteraceae bacterium]|jgi:acetyl esterase|nr:alpha/beta hydrolase [Ilumatobacteraceae bacterium]
MPLHPDARALLDLLEQLGQPAIHEVGAGPVRELRARMVVPSTIEVGEARDLDAGGVPARLYRPSTVAGPELTGVLVWLHGGGWALGTLDESDDTARALCEASGHRVLSVDYRLAPEHPYPAGLTDCLTAVRWVAHHAAELGVDPARVAVGGDSAGANLAAVVANLQPAGLRFQVLVYPVTDARCEGESYDRYGTGHLLTTESMRWFVQAYLGDGPGTPVDPRVSPLLAAEHVLAGAPPALVITADHDPLHDEGRAYAERLLAAGVAASHVCFHGQVHGFFGLPSIVGDAGPARRLVGAAVAAALAQPDGLDRSEAS